MSSPGLPANPNRRQKRMGPAPFASFEDLSDELESPEDKNAQGAVVRLPGIREDVTPSSPAPSQHSIKTEFIYTGISLVGAPSTPIMTNNPILPSTPLLGNKEDRLQALSAPRIDISRASSSSHHDSRDSSPEPEKEKNLKLGLGFREEGTQELRTSTEELTFQDKNQQKVIPRSQSPVPYDDSYHSHNRKDSQSSEIGLLCISGRTSRLSSIGSQGSAHSRISNASHLSVISNQSGISRSPSPHKMLLETSFCGTKPQHKDSEFVHKEGTKEDMELVLLKRKHDPTQALLAEGIEVPKKSEKVQNSIKNQPKPQQKTDITITIDKPTNDVLKPKLPKRIVADSGVEYIYIPLKGPLPEDNTTSASSNGRIYKHKVRETKSASLTPKTNPKEIKPTSKSASPSPLVSRHHNDDEPKYIRIKLKPDHLYDDSDKSSSIQKPDSLDLNDPLKKPVQTFEQIISFRSESPVLNSATSPRLKQHLKEPKTNKSPSPSLSRKSSFTSLFKSKETISPESPLVTSRRKSGEHKRERRRSRSKSRDRTSLGPSSSESIDSKGKPKSVFSIFKSKKSSQKDLDKVSTELPNLEGLVLEECQNNDRRSPKPSKRVDANQPDHVRIPLHSPTYYEQKHVLQECKTSSQDSQDTVIEVAPKLEQKFNNTNIVQVHDSSNTRQNSTSSENLVFSTKLGSCNEIFTTKLPKNKEEKITMAIVETKTPVAEENEDMDLKSDDLGNFSGKINDDYLSNVENENNNTFEIDEDVVKLEWSKPEVFNASPRVKTEFFSETNDEWNLSNLSNDLCDNNVVGNVINKNIEAAKEEDRLSSESEKDIELGKKDLSLEEIEPERKGLVLQQDSFEDELPYVPTTLPLERSVALPIIPIKQRSTFEIKTYPIERPRSTTPINPTCLEDYCEDVIGNINLENITSTIEKLRISLPRDDDKQPKVKSPRRTDSGTWFDFNKLKKPPGEETPPPLPPKGVQREWINFEEIPEKRKAPKRIQTIPSRSNIEVPETENVIYTYVNPEDCKCECHERSVKTDTVDETDIREDEMPLLENDQIDDEKVLPTDKMKLDITILDRRSTVSDSSVDLSLAEHVETNGIDNSIRTPFTSDLGISSNRSSVISQDVQSPDTDSTNAFPKNN